MPDGTTRHYYVDEAGDGTILEGERDVVNLVDLSGRQGRP